MRSNQVKKGDVLSRWGKGIQLKGGEGGSPYVLGQEDGLTDGGKNESKGILIFRKKETDKRKDFRRTLYLRRGRRIIRGRPRGRKKGRLCTLSVKSPLSSGQANFRNRGVLTGRKKVP